MTSDHHRNERCDLWLFAFDIRSVHYGAFGSNVSLGVNGLNRPAYCLRGQSSVDCRESVLADASLIQYPVRLCPLKSRGRPLASQCRTSTDPEVLELTRGVITYIRELVRSRRKPVRDCARYEARIWAYEMPEAFQPLESGAEGILFSIAHIPARPYPLPPAVIAGWLDDEALAEPDRGEPELAEYGPVQVSSGWADGAMAGSITVPRNQAQDVLRAYGGWLPLWREWAREERILRPHRELYRRLSEMARRVEQADDEYEVVIGVGLLANDLQGRRQLNRHLTRIRE